MQQQYMCMGVTGAGCAPFSAIPQLSPQQTLTENPQIATWAPRKQQANGHVTVLSQSVMVHDVQIGGSVTVHPQKHVSIRFRLGGGWPTIH